MNCRLLWFNGCKGFDDRCAAIVGRFSELRELQAMECGLTDVGLEQFGKLTKLRRLSIYDDGITDAGIAHIAALKDLEWLDLPPRITDAALATISELPYLQRLSLRNNGRITDAGLQHLAKLDDLFELHLEGTKVTKEGVAKLQEALPDCEIFSDVAPPFTFMPTTPLAPAPTTTPASAPSKTDADGASSKPLDQQSTGWHGWPADAPAPAIAPFDEEQARKHQQAWADYLKLPLEYTNTIGMKFILIPPGEFLMGSGPEVIEELKQEELKQVVDSKGSQVPQSECQAPQHKVILTQPFYMAVHETTQKEYYAVMGKNPSLFATVADLDTGNLPVESVSWYDAGEFCAKLSEKNEDKPFYTQAGEKSGTLGKGTGYRLPTEAEWEFACRAGTTTKFWTGEESPSGWIESNSEGRTHEVEDLPENPFGLFDINGNVHEWVEDAFEPRFYWRLRNKPAIDPKYQYSAGGQRLLRGGCWADTNAYCCWSAFRGITKTPWQHGVWGIGVCGFRVALEVMRNEKPPNAPDAPASPTNSNAP
jgi:formylglycine-generating enzyme required for sulfatase activity